MVHTASYYYKNSTEMISSIKKKHPDMSTKEIKSKLGSMWKTLSVEDKAPYMRMVEEASRDLVCDEVPNDCNQMEEISLDDRLDTELVEEQIEVKTVADNQVKEEVKEVVKEVVKEEVKEEVKEVVKEEVKEEVKEVVKEEVKEGKVSIPEGMKLKKPKSSFMFYLYDKDIRSKFSETKGSKLVKEISIQWNALSEEDKKPWIKMYESEKQKLLDNPEFVKIKQVKKKDKKEEVVELKETENLNNLSAMIVNLEQELMKLQSEVKNIQAKLN